MAFLFLIFDQTQSGLEPAFIIERMVEQAHEIDLTNRKPGPETARNPKHRNPEPETQEPRTRKHRTRNP